MSVVVQDTTTLLTYVIRESRSTRLPSGSFKILEVSFPVRDVNAYYLQGTFNVRNTILRQLEIKPYFPFTEQQSNIFCTSNEPLVGLKKSSNPPSLINIYLAGPFFTPSQIEEQQMLFTYLSSLGYTVRSALNNGINLRTAYATLEQYLPSTEQVSENAYYLNIAVSCYDIYNALKFGDITVANVGPLQPPSTNEDSGTIVECSYSISFQHPVVFWNSYPPRILPALSNQYTGFPNPMIMLAYNDWNLTPSEVPLETYCTNSLEILRERLFLVRIDPTFSPMKSGFPTMIQNQVDLGEQVSQITNNEPEHQH